MNFFQELKNFSLAHLARNSEEAIVEATEKLHDKIADEVHRLISEAMSVVHLTPVPPVTGAPSPAPVAPPAPVETPAATPTPAEAPSASVETPSETPQTGEDHV